MFGGDLLHRIPSLDSIWSAPVHRSPPAQKKPFTMLNQLLEIGVQQTRFSNSSIVQATLYCRSKRFTTKCMRATEEQRRICQNSKLEGSSCSWSSDRGRTTTILNQLLCTTPDSGSEHASVSSSHASFPVIWVEWSVTLVRVSHLEREKTKDAVSKMKLQRFVVKHTQKFYFAKKTRKKCVFIAEVC